MKVRSDFVSNSSSSSYICVSDFDSKEFLKKLQTPVWPDKPGEDTFISSSTALLICDCVFTVGYLNGGYCVYNEDLKTYFDDNGRLKSNLKYDYVIQNIRHASSNTELGSYHCSRVTDKTVQFSEWIYKEFKDRGYQFRKGPVGWYDENGKHPYEDWEQIFLNAIEKVKKALNDNKYCYYVMTSYDGNGNEWGKFYVNTTGRYLTERDNAISETIRVAL